MQVAMQTAAEFIAEFKSGAETLNEDEYAGENGLPYCKKCHTPRFFISDDRTWATRTACECQHTARLREQEKEKLRRATSEYERKRSLSLLGERYANARFSNATITEHNREAFEKVKHYVDNYQTVYKSNIGLYFYGDNSSGKTYITACICNELMWRKCSCIYTNLASILNEIRSSYDGKGDECEILYRLREYQFAFIDDLGKEFIGREYRPDSAKWAEEKLFEVINERYNAQKPTIFSSNYSIEELYTVLGLDKAIVERIDEMSTRVIKIEGDDFRSIVGKEKSEFAKKLGI